MRNSEVGSAIMTTPYEAMKQQRLMWGAALIVGFILIYYGGAPIMPVIVGCVSVPAITALRSWFRSRK
jgi:predicted PurR-regulated permease PerM